MTSPCGSAALAAPAAPMPPAPPPTITVLATVFGVTALLWGDFCSPRRSFTKGEKALTILIAAPCQGGAHEGARHAGSRDRSGVRGGLDPRPHRQFDRPE